MRSLCNYSHSRVLRYLVVILISVSRMTNDVPYLPVIICFCIYLLRPFAWFIVGLFIFLSFEDSVYVLDTGLLSYLSFANIFSCVLFFHSLDSVRTKRKCRCGWRVDQVSQCGREANRQQLAGAERCGRAAAAGEEPVQQEGSAWAVLLTEAEPGGVRHFPGDCRPRGQRG